MSVIDQDIGMLHNSPKEIYLQSNPYLQEIKSHRHIKRLFLFVNMILVIVTEMQLHMKYEAIITKP